MPMESTREVSSISTRQDWNDLPIVRVLGVVMTRNDAIGGWVPYLDGGQSKVGIHESLDGKSFRIYGWRVSDKNVTLDCCIQINMTFHETNGTFHHWQIGSHRMGLTFYSPAEARSFDRGIRVAMEKLAKVAANSGGEGSSSRSDSRQSTCHSPGSSTGSTSSKRHHLSRKVKKKSSSSTSSVNQAPARPAKPGHVGRASCVKMSSNSTQMAHNKSPQIVQGVSVISTAASPLSCDTPPSCDTTSHFRYPITSFSNSLTCGRYHQPSATTGFLSTSVPAPHFREHEIKTHTIPKTNGSVTTPTKDVCTRSTIPVQHSRHSPRHNRQRVLQARRHEDTYHTSGNKASKSTKTPHLDFLEQHRERQPTEQNSYVLFASAKANTTIGSSESSARKNLSPGGGLSSSLRRDYNSLSTFANPKHSNSTYQPATIGNERFYNSRIFFEFEKTKTDSNTDSIFEPSNRLLSTSSPSKVKGQEPHSFFNSRKINDYDDNDNTTSRCCFCKNPFRKSRMRRSNGRYQKEDLAERSKCKYCNEMYVHTKNKPGACRGAPDPCLKCIEGVTCMNCAKNVLCRCSRNSDMERPCTCSGIQENRSGFFCRWSALTALSFIIPCLCLYPPLRTCHCCAVKCHCCGGRHEASRQPSNTDKRSTLKR